MPVVAFNHCDIPEIIQNGISGFLVPERDVDALAEKLIYLIEHPEIWREMGQAGRAHVEATQRTETKDMKLSATVQKWLFTWQRNISCLKTCMTLFCETLSGGH